MSVTYVRLFAAAQSLVDTELLARLVRVPRRRVHRLVLAITRARARRILALLLLLQSGHCLLVVAQVARRALVVWL